MHLTLVRFPWLAASFLMAVLSGCASTPHTQADTTQQVRAAQATLTSFESDPAMWELASSREMLMIIAGMTPGTSVGFDVWRRGAQTRLAAVVGELGPRATGAGRLLAGSPVDRIGLTLLELTPGERQEFETEGALPVRSATGAAGRAGIRQGDVILVINDARLDRVVDLDRALTALPADSVVALLVFRDDTRIYVAVRLVG